MNKSQVSVFGSIKDMKFPYFIVEMAPYLICKSIHAKSIFENNEDNNKVKNRIGISKIAESRIFTLCNSLSVPFYVQPYPKRGL